MRSLISLRTASARRCDSFLRNSLTLGLGRHPIMNDEPSDPPVSRHAPPSANAIAEGVGAAPGIAIGPLHVYDTTTPEVRRTHVESDEVDEEIDRFDEAIQQAKDALNTVQSVAQDHLDPDGEAIFEVQGMMLRDEEVMQAVRQRIRDEHESAPQALRVVLRRHKRRLEDSDDEYLRQRAADLDELRNRLLRLLQQGEAVASIEPDSIVVADRLSTAEVIRFSQHGMLGCVTAQGGRTSHVSIIARALNVPAMVGVEGLLDVAADHQRAILDGHRGQLLLGPNDETLEIYRRRQTQHQSLRAESDSAPNQPTETVDGRQIVVRANVEFRETLNSLRGYGAEGIGLLRTEMLFLGREETATEKEQLEVYRTAAEQTGDHGATIRLLDLGGDKLLPTAQHQDNPFLGWRGIRVLLDRQEELLRPQIRALLRANTHGTLRVMLPMVTHLDEVHEVRSIVGEEADRLAADGVDHDPDLPIGIMVEVPSVALQAEAFSEVSDLMSIGTNDLTQYVLAVDRGNDLVADRFDALHPAVLRLVKHTVEAGEKKDIPVSLCGEIAGEAYAAPILIGLGLDVLSASPPFLPRLRTLLGEITYQDAKVLAETACAAADAEAVRRIAHEWIDQHVDTLNFDGAESPLIGTEGLE